MSPDIPPAAPSGITPRQQRLIDALAMGASVTRAAGQSGISRRTAYNWMADEAFQSALAARRRELAERVAERMAELGQVCVSTLIDVLQADQAIGYERQSQAELAERLLAGMGLLSASGGKSADRS